MQSLGLRLREARIHRGDRQVDLAARIGVSRQTIIRMEGGGTGVPLDVWLAASEAVGLLETWAGVLVIPEDPFQEYDKKIAKTPRNPRRSPPRGRKP